MKEDIVELCLVGFIVAMLVAYQRTATASSARDLEKDLATMKVFILFDILSHY